MTAAEIRARTKKRVEMNKMLDQLGLPLKDFTGSFRNEEFIDQRWVSIGITHFQEGFAALRRSLYPDDAEKW